MKSEESFFNSRSSNLPPRFFGPIYFLCFVFFVFFVLLNMFLAILCDSLGDVKAELTGKKKEYEVKDFMRDHYMALVDKMNLRTKKMDIQEALRITRLDGHTSLGEVSGVDKYRTIVH